MTKIRFFECDGLLIGYEISGHSTSSAQDINGKIVCSAVSSAAYMAANTLSEIVGAELEAEVSDGYMCIKLKSLVEQSQITLKGFYLHASELAKNYRNYVKVYSEV
ncbi:MAG: ribosomal-processing cysteine protease Prp [Clostridia bacterium]|nr:ribosomal-processing cysteine protease Prp [Clostridia bacterium]